MDRDTYQNLLKWKENRNRKPLILKGARQVGKTFILEGFGKKEYDDTVLLDFDRDEEAKLFFEKNLDPKRIIRDLEIFNGRKIVPGKTLLIFDEIQECPKALNSLKYFNQSANEYHVVSAGSLLGIMLSRQESFPVGKVTFMDLYPLSFFEFLSAIQMPLLRKAIEGGESLSEPIHQKAIDQLKLYYVIGGMPEAVTSFLNDSTDFVKIRKIQQDILDSYQLDFAKHSEKNQVLKLSHVWNSIPGQLSRENKKFKFTDINKHVRAREYEEIIIWLKNAGMVIQSKSISAPRLPLEGYVKKNQFKLFVLDVGLLGAMSRLPPKALLEGDTLFSEFKGALVENFVAQELLQSGHLLYYWANRPQAEVDFVIMINGKVIPLEVKAGLGRKTTSLQVYANKFHPERLLRTSLRNYQNHGDLINIPLYAVSLIRIFTV